MLQKYHKISYLLISGNLHIHRVMSMPKGTVMIQKSYPLSLCKCKQFSTTTSLPYERKIDPLETCCYGNGNFWCNATDPA